MEVFWERPLEFKNPLFRVQGTTIAVEDILGVAVRRFRDRLSPEFQSKKLILAHFTPVNVAESFLKSASQGNAMVHISACRCGSRSCHLLSEYCDCISTVLCELVISRSIPDQKFVSAIV